MEKKCLVCGDSFQGRSDKKFCSADCRSQYHNNQNREASRFITKINRILKKNREILKQANPQGKTKIHQSKLTAEGFNFNYFTNVYKTKGGNYYYFCYDQGYLALDNGYFTLVIKQDFIP